MKSTQIGNGGTLADEDLGHATVRELIVQLALTEDEQRSAVDPGRIAILARCEQAIVAALQRNGLALKGPSNPGESVPWTDPPSSDDVAVQQ